MLWTSRKHDPSSVLLLFLFSIAVSEIRWSEGDRIVRSTDTSLGDCIAYYYFHNTERHLYQEFKSKQM